MEAEQSQISRGPKVKKGIPCGGRGVREGPEGCEGESHLRNRAQVVGVARTRGTLGGGGRRKQATETGEPAPGPSL